VNEIEQERFESELQRMRPAQPPQPFMARLASSRPALPHRPAARALGVSRGFSWDLVLRCLAPAMALVVAVALCWRLGFPAPKQANPVNPDQATVGLKADDVQIAHELVSSFDAVARLPSGEPVRFRCRKWMDQVVFSDRNRGIVVEERRPRVEVVPVRFETD